MSLEHKTGPGFLQRTHAAVSFAVVGALTGSACAPEAIKTPSKSVSTPITTIANPENLVDLPIPPDLDIHIQQGWNYEDKNSGGFHGAQDYIKGKIDNPNTWQTFQVLAPGNGEVCANPEKRQGETVWMTLYIKGKLHYWVGGHLSKIENYIQQCSSGIKVPVKRGQVLGTSGDTGAPGLIHLHSEFKNMQDQPVDAYDLRAGRERYPDPMFSNGKLCGAEALLLKCKEQAIRLGQAMGLIVAEPKPTQRTQIDEIKAATVVPTIRPTEVKPAVTETKRNLTPEQEAAKGALDIWFGELNKTWGKPGVINPPFSSNRNYVQTKINNKAFTSEDIATGRLKVEDSKNGMYVRWVLEDTTGKSWAYALGENQIAGIKVEIKDFSQPSDTDKRNNIGPQAEAIITFSQKYRFFTQKGFAPNDGITKAINTSFTGSWAAGIEKFTIQKVGNDWAHHSYYRLYNGGTSLPLGILGYLGKLTAIPESRCPNGCLVPPDNIPVPFL